MKFIGIGYGANILINYSKIINIIFIYIYLLIIIYNFSSFI
jgi:hypothetical protein